MDSVGPFLSKMKSVDLPWYQIDTITIIVAKLANLAAR